MSFIQRPRSTEEHNQGSWLWFVGLARMCALCLAAIGAYRFGPRVTLEYLLLLLYGLAIGTNLLYLAAIRKSQNVPLLLTWTQMLVDFGVCIATLSLTGGVQSFFAFLLVIVILEAGLLLGLPHGFLFATLASVFMAVQAASPPPPAPSGQTAWIDLWYRFLIQALAFYLTAFVSGYWNRQIYRMKQFQRDILDNMNSGFLTTDQNGIIIAQNRSACEILDLPESNAVGKSVEQVLRVASGGECPVTTALRSRRDFISYEFQAITGSNEIKLLGLTTSQIYDSRGHLIGVIASFTDLTEIAHMRQELQSQDRLAAVGELATGLAHEIRNPVASIRGAVDELQSMLENPALAKKLAAIAIRESDHLNHIVSGFLDFARSPNLKREVFDLRDIVTEVHDLLQLDYASSKDLTLRMSLPNEPCLGSGAPSQIKQVFVNLGKNGIEAMNEKGTLSFILTCTPNFLEARVEDEGPGIPPDKVTRIFEPFYSEKERGVGMGLAICSRIVTAHDGTIRAGSREAGGAAFTVRLPAARMEA
jgi:two-component system sensor histidine kinase PilS (NtrC family)